MIETYPSSGEARAECPEGWLVSAVVTKADEDLNPLEYAYFNVPAETAPDKMLTIGFEIREGKPMEELQRYLIAMATGQVPA